MSKTLGVKNIEFAFGYAYFTMPKRATKAKRQIWKNRLLFTSLYEKSRQPGGRRDYREHYCKECLAIIKPQQPPLQESQ